MPGRLWAVAGRLRGAVLGRLLAVLGLDEPATEPRPEAEAAPGLWDRGLRDLGLRERGLEERLDKRLSGESASRGEGSAPVLGPSARVEHVRGGDPADLGAPPCAGEEAAASSAHDALDLALNPPTDPRLEPSLGGVFGSNGGPPLAPLVGRELGLLGDSEDEAAALGPTFGDRRGEEVITRNWLELGGRLPEASSASTSLADRRRGSLRARAPPPRAGLPLEALALPGDAPGANGGRAMGSKGSPSPTCGWSTGRLCDCTTSRRMSGRGGRRLGAGGIGSARRSCAELAMAACRRLST